MVIALVEHVEDVDGKAVALPRIAQAGFAVITGGGPRAPDARAAAQGARMAGGMGGGGGPR